MLASQTSTYLPTRIYRVDMTITGVTGVLRLWCALGDEHKIYYGDG